MPTVSRYFAVTALAGVGLLAPAAASHAADVAAATSPAPATTTQAEPSREQIMHELQTLREQLQRLEQRQTDAQAQADRQAAAAEVDATVSGVLADADRRSQLLQAQGFTAGWNKGKFLIQSEDGNFVLSPQFWFQPRYVANYREEDGPNPIDGDAATEEGFEIRRMKFIFEGNVFSPKFKYKFQLNANRSNGNAVLEDAFVSYKFNDLFAVKLGQYKEPTFHEEIMSDTRQLAVERSLVNFTLGGGVTDRVQGVALVIDDGPDKSPFRGEVGFTDGPNTDNTNFTNGGGSAFVQAASPDFGAYGRVEYLAFGEWKSYEDFTALGNKESLLAFGAGASYAQAGSDNTLLHTVDAQYEVGKLGLYGAYYGVYSDGDDGNLYDAGLLAQAGYLLNDKWEVFARYEYIKPDDARGAAFDDDYHVLAAGVNYYIKAHALKVTVDLSYLPNGTPINADGAGILDPDADEEQFVLRGQFQLLL